MAGDYENMTPLYILMLDISGYFFSFVFFVEATLKLIAY